MKDGCLITPAGFRRLREEYDALYAGERPRLLETIAWAAANGDRSENADYHYGRKRLREVDRRINFLSRCMAEARVVDPSRQTERDRAWFGASITIENEDGESRVVMLVGEEEADAALGRISWNSPMARALRGAKVGDLRQVVLPGGTREYQVIAISYPDGD